MTGVTRLRLVSDEGIITLNSAVLNAIHIAYTGFKNSKSFFSKSKCFLERLLSRAAAPPMYISSASPPSRLKSPQRKSLIPTPQPQTKKCNTEVDFVDLEQAVSIQEGATEIPSRFLLIDHANNRNRKDIVAVLDWLWG